MARRLSLLVVILGLMIPGPPAHAQAVPGVGGFACAFKASQWPGGTGFSAECGAGLLPGEGTAWGLWSNGSSSILCNPLCSAYAELYYDPAICVAQSAPPTVTTGTGKLILNGSHQVDFSWLLVGNAFVFTQDEGSRVIGGTGTFVPDPPIVTCSYPYSQTGHVTATISG
jgi:hypothetical protein